MINDCTADSKDQESVQSSITCEKGHHMGKYTIWESTKHTRKHHSQESREVNPCPAGDHKAVRNIKIVKQK